MIDYSEIEKDIDFAVDRLVQLFEDGDGVRLAGEIANLYNSSDVNFISVVMAEFKESI